MTIGQDAATLLAGVFPGVIPPTHIQLSRFCPGCCINITIVVPEPQINPVELFCSEDGYKLYPNHPEYYRARKIRAKELSQLPAPISCYPCRYCGNNCFDGDWFCDFCGTRQRHRPESSYRQHQQILRERRLHHLLTGKA